MITLKTTDVCILATTPIPTTLPSQTDFNNFYWAAQPTPLQASQYAPFSPTEALALIAQDYVVDNEIMVIGWDAYLCMIRRLADGYVWYPNAEMPPVTIAPGLSLPGFVTYNPTAAPNGAISVSLNPADYPSFTVPPAPLPPTDLVGAAYGFNYTYQQKAYPAYMSNPGTDNSSVSSFSTYTDVRGTFTKIVNNTPFGAEVFWILTGPVAS